MLRRPTKLVMNALIWTAAVMLLALVVAGQLALMWRSSYLQLLFRRWLIALAAGLAAAIPANILELLVLRWTQLDLRGVPGSDPSLMFFTLLVAVPLEMASVTLVAGALWRMRRVSMRAGLSRSLETQEAIAFATTTAMGFATMDNIVYLWLLGDGWWALLRVALWQFAFVLLAGIWGYVLGRNAVRGMRSKRFSTAWFVATIFAAVCDQLIFRRSHMALVAVLPLTLSLAGLGWWAWRDAIGAVSSGGAASSMSFHLLPTSAPPSLEAIRDAFQQRDRPVTLRWITFGALVTTGLIATAVVVAVVLAGKLGLDFSAVERADTGSEALAPLTLLGMCVLAAFPIAGYLLARASGTRSVMEPAMGAALAMVMVMIFMGLAAPVSVVFAIAFSPVAFALSCMGAWMGLSH